MKQTIDMYQFERAFKNMDRGEQFSYEGLQALYLYLEEYEEDVELDVIALCCKYAEYDSLKEFQADYGNEYDDIDEIENHTQVIPVGSESFIIQQF